MKEKTLLIYDPLRSYTTNCSDTFEKLLTQLVWKIRRKIVETPAIFPGLFASATLAIESRNETRGAFLIYAHRFWSGSRFALAAETRNFYIFSGGAGEMFAQLFTDPKRALWEYYVTTFSLVAVAVVQKLVAKRKKK